MTRKSLELGQQLLYVVGCQAQRGPDVDGWLFERKLQEYIHVHHCVQMSMEERALGHLARMRQALS